MKKTLATLTFLLLLMTASLNAQYSGAKDAAGFKFVANNHYQPKFSDKLFDTDVMGGGAEINYTRAINDWLAIGIPFRLNTHRYASVDPTRKEVSKNFFTPSVDAILKLQYFKPNNFLVPFVYGGVGAQYSDNAYLNTPKGRVNGSIPVGAGIGFRLANNFYLNAGTEYRNPFTQDPRNQEHWAHFIGFQALIGDYVEPAPVIMAPIDTDKDGIPDSVDKCPDVAGLAAFNGCPDTDGDGVIDSEDQCPTIAGTIATAGCPDRDNDGVADSADKCPDAPGPISTSGCPDSDGDGILDIDDKCPREAGTAAMGGCPDSDGDGIMDSQDRCPKAYGPSAMKGCPDGDGDGVADLDDKCPTKVGPVSNQGCPEITKEDKKVLDFAMSAVEFESGKSVIKTGSYSILDQVVTILTKYNEYKVSIEGHTDNVGNEGNNQKLSNDRAKACYDYLVSKGISSSRMKFQGFGSANPIGDNKTAAGRQRNRRTEFKTSL
jgi:OmpA-OmpF porin, OOP family